MTVGTQLRQARSEQKRSLSDIARETKIQGWVLEALEADQLHQQMSPVYVKGFLTTYAKSLHLAPEPLIAELLWPQPAPVQESLPPPPPPRRPVSIRVPKILTGRLGSALALGACVVSLVLFTPLRGWIMHQSTATLAAIRTHSTRVASQRKARPASRKITKAAPTRLAPASPSTTASTASAPPPAAAPVTTLAAMVPLADPLKLSAPAPKPTIAKPTTPPPLTLIPGKPLELVLTVQKTMWVRVRADGKLLTQQRLPRGTTERWTAKKVLEIIVASPAEAGLTLNDQSIDALVQSHQGRLMITHHGVTRLPDD